MCFLTIRRSFSAFNHFYSLLPAYDILDHYGHARSLRRASARCGEALLVCHLIGTSNIKKTCQKTTPQSPPGHNEKQTSVVLVVGSGCTNLQKNVLRIRKAYQVRTGVFFFVFFLIVLGFSIPPVWVLKNETRTYILICTSGVSDVVFRCSRV